MDQKKDLEGTQNQNIRSQIDENLRRVYEHALKEEVPDRFRELIERLRREADRG